jgi:transcriptional regulator with XRE-family HTH domain
MELSRLLLAEIERRGSSYAEAAREIGCNPAVLNRWIHPGSEPSKDYLVPLARYLGMPVGQLMAILGYPVEQIATGALGAEDLAVAERALRFLREHYPRETWPKVINAWEQVAVLSGPAGGDGATGPDSSVDARPDSTARRRNNQGQTDGDSRKNRQFYGTSAAVLWLLRLAPRLAELLQPGRLTAPARALA